MNTLYFSIVFAGFGGGIVRGLVGYIKNHLNAASKKFELLYFLLMMFLSRVVGLLSTHCFRESVFKKLPKLVSYIRMNQNSGLWKLSNIKFILVFSMILFGSFLFVKSASAATYYVDATLGLDTNDGLAATTGDGHGPFKTVAKVISGTPTLAAGDSVLFKRGETWREQLTVPTSGSIGLPITFGAYGVGAEKPIINGADIVSGWVQDADYSGWAASGGSSSSGDFNFRKTVPANAFLVDGTKIRVKFKAPATQATVLSSVYVGQAASAGDVFDMEAGTVTQILFGGLAGVTVPAGTEVWSDWLTFAYDHTKIHLISYGSTAWFAAWGPIDATNNYFKAGSTSAGTADVTSYTTNTTIYEISDIQIDQSSLTNIWNAALISNPTQVFFNGTLGTRVVSVAALTGANEWYWAAGSLYVYSTSDPTTAYTSPGIEASQRDGISISSKDYITINGIRATNGNAYGFYETASTNLILTSIDVDHSRLEAFKFATSGSVTATDCTASYAFKGIESGADGFNIGGSVVATLTNSTSHHNDGDGFSTNDSSTLNCYFCSAHDNGPTGYGGDGFTNHNSSTLNIYYGVAHDNTKSGAAVTGTGGGKIYNSVFYNNWNGVGANWLGDIGIGIQSTGIWDIKNNITMGHQDEFFIDAASFPGLTLTSDYNIFWDSRKASYGNKSFHWNGTDYIWADFKIQSGTDAHSLNSDPLFVSTSDFNPQSTSPAIDTGTTISGLTTDYAGNPIYGTPDIGGYEYQPSHTMGTDRMDIGAGARVYGDGKFRDVGTTNSTLADLKITPSAGTFTETTSPIPAWLDISNITWSNTGNHHKVWTESNAEALLNNTLHTVGDLEAGKYYNVTIDGGIADLSGCSTVGLNYVCQANPDGKISFTWGGGYSTHTFDVIEGDNTAPVRSGGLPSGSQSAGTTQVTLSLITNESSTCKYSTTAGTAYGTMADSFTTTNGTTHTATVFTSNGQSYSYYVRCWDSVGNTNIDDYTISFSVASPSGGGGSPAIWTLPIVPLGGFKISINGGVSTTSNRNVFLSFNAGTDIKKIAISMTGDFTDASQDDYVASKQWDLCSKIDGLVKNQTCPDGTYTVYAKFYTVYGKSSNTAIASSAIILKSGSGVITYLDNGVDHGQTPATSSSLFKQNLWAGLDNQEVARLQQSLREFGLFNYPTNSGFYGLITITAIQKFQCKYDIVCGGEAGETGYGVFGPKTREKLNEVKGLQTAQTNTGSSAQAQTTPSTQVQTTQTQIQITQSQITQQLEKQIQSLQKMLDGLIKELKEKVLGV